MTGSVGDSAGKSRFIDEGEPVESIRSSGEICDSGAVDWPGIIGSPGAFGWSSTAGCAGTRDGLVTGTAAATMDGFGYWNTQS